MPAYGASGPATQTTLGSFVWENEVVDPSDPSGEPSSIPIGLKRSENHPNCVSAEVEFSADPGAFQIDLQTADTNEEKYFVTKASLDETGVNDDFIGRIEATNIVAKLVRLKMVSLTNASVEVSAKIF